jgi:hypothetical protein
VDDDVAGILGFRRPSASAAPALTLARIPVTAKIVLDPAVLGGGGAVLDAWGPLARDAAFGDDGARLTKGFIGVRMHEVGRCRLKVSKPGLKAPMVLALET